MASLLDLASQLPSSFTFSSGFKSEVRRAVPLTTFEGVPHEFQRALSVPFGFYMTFLSTIQDGCFRLFSGEQPDCADAYGGSQCLVELTKTSQEVFIRDGVVVIQINMTGIALKSGVASWVRVYRTRLGELETAISFDCGVGTRRSKSAFIVMPNTYVQRHSEIDLSVSVLLPDNLMFMDEGPETQEEN